MGYLPRHRHRCAVRREADVAQITRSIIIHCYAVRRHVVT